MIDSNSDGLVTDEEIDLANKMQEGLILAIPNSGVKYLNMC